MEKPTEYEIKLMKENIKLKHTLDGQTDRFEFFFFGVSMGLAIAWLYINYG